MSGNNTDALLGVCESMYRPGLQPEELFETISQCLLSAVNRDCLSGWGGVVHIITNHHQQIQLAPSRGPPSSFSAPSVGLPDEIA